MPAAPVFTGTVPCAVTRCTPGGNAPCKSTSTIPFMCDSVWVDAFPLDTDPAPPAALGVRLHIAGLTSPLHAQIKGQGPRSLEVGLNLASLAALEMRDFAGCDRIDR